MFLRQLYRAARVLALPVFLVTGCDNGPGTLDDCLLKATRESQNDRQFRNMAERCKEQFRKH